MDLIELYPAAVNSKVTVTLGVMNADSTIVEVLDGSVLPEAPNLLVLGTDQTAETVRMTAKEGNKLTIERAVQGEAIAWPAGTQVARNFTAKDWNDMIANIANIVAKVMGLSAADVHARPDTWMPTAADVGALKVYGSFSELGLAESSATADSIVTAMDNNSMLLCDCSNTATSATLKFPATYGLLKVIKKSNNYAEFEYRVGSNVWYGYYNKVATTPWIGWIQHFKSDGGVPMSGELKYFDGSKTLAYPVPMANAGFHNSVYRGKSLGSAVTADQWAAIKAGTFENMYIGDYWTIGGINYRIAAFDYYYKTGDTSCETHHVVLVPDTSMYTHVMNDTNITDGAYVGSKMYTAGLTQAKTTINNAFGSAHILKHRQYLQNATSNGISTGGAWYDSTVELMTEQNVYGCKIFGDVVHGTTFPNNYTIDKSQYPLFTFRPDMISNRQWFWLRDVANASSFADVHSYGYAYNYTASYAGGVRPAFSIC